MDRGRCSRPLSYIGYNMLKINIKNNISWRRNMTSLSPRIQTKAIITAKKFGNFLQLKTFNEG